MLLFIQGDRLTGALIFAWQFLTWYYLNDPKNSHEVTHIHTVWIFEEYFTKNTEDF